MGLMCYTTLVVTLGLLMAILTGLAYGYNYSMAEFIAIGKENNMTFYIQGGRLVTRYTETPTRASVATTTARTNASSSNTTSAISTSSITTSTATTSSVITSSTATLSTSSGMAPRRRFFVPNDYEQRLPAETFESKVEIAIPANNEPVDTKKHPRRSTIHGDLYLEPNEQQLGENGLKQALIPDFSIARLKKKDNDEEEHDEKLKNFLLKWQIDNREAYKTWTDKVPENEKPTDNGVENMLLEILRRLEMGKEETSRPLLTRPTVNPQVRHYYEDLVASDDNMQ